MGDLLRFKGDESRIMYIAESLQQVPKSSSKFSEALGAIALFAGLIAVVYAALLLSCAVDNSCAAIFMEPVR